MMILSRRFLRHGVAWLVLWALAWCAAAQPAVPVSGQAVAGLEAFDAAMLATLDKHGYAGGTLAVSYQGRLVLNKAYGFASKGLLSGTPMAVDQRMRIASLSKWITAVAVLQAAEQGKLKLDQPFVELLGWAGTPQSLADPRVARISVRQLLQNHAGWVIDRSNDPMFQPVPRCPGDAQAWVAGQTLAADPGLLFSYGNINFCLAQLVLEKMAGQPYAEVVKAQLAGPLGLSSWQLATAPAAPDEPHYPATPATRSTPVSQAILDGLGGAGAWTSTARDYLRFLDALRGHRGKPLLTPESWAQLTRRPAAPESADKPWYYGLGVLVRVLDNGRFNLWHHGSLEGTSSFAVTYANGWSLVAIFNGRVAGPQRDAASAELDRTLAQALRASGTPQGEIRP